MMRFGRILFYVFLLFTHLTIYAQNSPNAEILTGSTIPLNPTPITKPPAVLDSYFIFNGNFLLPEKTNGLNETLFAEEIEVIQKSYQFRPTPHFGWKSLSGQFIKIWQLSDGKNCADLFTSSNCHGITQKLPGTPNPGMYILHWQQFGRTFANELPKSNRYFVRLTIGNPSKNNSPDQEAPIELFSKKFEDDAENEIPKKYWSDQLFSFHLPKELSEQAKKRGLWITFDVLNCNESTRYSAIIRDVKIMPVVLCDEQNIASSQDDKTIIPQKSSTDYSSSNIAWIRAHTSAHNIAPSMPALSLKILNLPQDWKMKTQFSANFNRKRNRLQNEDQILIPSRNLAVSTTGFWNIYSDPNWIEEVSHGFFGGNCSILIYLVRPDGENSTKILPGQALQFRILGQNPDPKLCFHFIKSLNNSPWFAPYIARTCASKILGSVTSYEPYQKEKSLPSQFAQFYPLGQFDNAENLTLGTEGFPVEYDLKNRNTLGIGLFQIPEKNDLPETTNRDLLWNWQTNAETAVKMINSPEFKERADRFFQILKTRHGNKFNEYSLPSLTFRNRTFDLRSCIWITAWYDWGIPIDDLSSKLIFSPNLPPGVSTPKSTKHLQWHWAPPYTNGKCAMDEIAENINTFGATSN